MSGSQGDSSPRVSVIVVSWNAGPVLGRCLESLETQRVAGGFETIVVNNASTDNTADVLREHADDVRVITNDSNVGFSVGNNRGAEAARGSILFFLNSDTELLGPDVLELLARAVEAPGIALAGPLLVNPDGTHQPSCAVHPTIGRALLVSSGLHRLLPDRLAVRVAPERWSHDRPTEIEWVMGAALAVRADVFKELGGFWPTLYSEEQDLAYRAQQRGLRARFEPAVRVMHVGNFSLGQRLTDSELHIRKARADLEFLRQHYRPWRVAAIRLVVCSGYAVRAIVHRAVGHRRRARIYLAMARVFAGVD